MTLPAATSTRRPRLGFLGVGWIGRLRLKAIAAADLAEIVALAEPDPDLAAAAGAVAPQAARVSSLHELWPFDLDGIVIASPSALHAEQTLDALRRGISVFCQKPLGRNAAEVVQLVNEARSADRLLGVDLSYRQVEGMQKIRQYLQEEALGEVFAVDLVFHNAYGPQKPWFYDRALSGGGCVIDLGIHLVDAALWALGAEVRSVEGSVYAQGKRLRPEDKEVEDYATAHLELSTGATVRLACSWHLHAGRPAVIEAAFYGTKGGAAMRNVDGSFFDFQTERFHGTERQVVAGPPEEWGGRAAVAWLRQLAQSARYDPAIEQQVQVAQTLDAIYGRGPLTSTH